MSDLPPTDPTALSPLHTASVETIFLSDPRKLSDADHRTLVSELRRRRSAFAAEEAAKAAKGKAARAKAEPLPAATAAALGKPTTELDLGDLL